MDLTTDQLVASRKYDMVQLKNMIENGFMHDWAISIEYAAKTEQNHVEWLKWDKTLFAIKDPGNVLDELIACCKSHPDCSMKLVCEHFSPEYRFVYCIHRKDKQAGESQASMIPVNA